MTFGNFILSLRERLNDLRKSDATLITLASEDGVRWTSSKLIAISNAAIDEGLRMASIYSGSPLVKSIALNGGLIRQSVAVTITAGSGTLTSAIGVPVEAKISSDTYAPISAENFYSYLNDNSQPRNEGKFFTVLYDMTAAARKIYFLPASTAGSAVFSYLPINSAYTSSNFADIIYPLGLDDFFLDIAEREARDREHSWERSKSLDMRILTKLGISLGA